MVRSPTTMRARRPIWLSQDTHLTHKTPACSLVAGGQDAGPLCSGVRPTDKKELGAAANGLVSEGGTDAQIAQS